MEMTTMKLLFIFFTTIYSVYGMPSIVINSENSHNEILAGPQAAASAAKSDGGYDMSVRPTPHCVSNKVFRPCGGCDVTCADAGKLIPCPMICLPKCVCPHKTVWSKKLNACVKKENCPSPEPKCESNKVFKTCAGCDVTCANMNQLIPCTKRCRRKCVCPGKTVWSKERNACVKRENCPPPAPKCESNKVFKTCAGCERTCEDLGKIIPCTLQCRRKCACPGEVPVWSKKKNACVKEENCPLPEPKCESNKVFSTCAGCDVTCANMDQLIPCTKRCRRKCACPGKTVWSEEDNACVEKEECPHHHDHPHHHD